MRIKRSLSVANEVTKNKEKEYNAKKPKLEKSKTTTAVNASVNPISSTPHLYKLRRFSNSNISSGNLSLDDTIATAAAAAAFSTLNSSSTATKASISHSNLSKSNKTINAKTCNRNGSKSIAVNTNITRKVNGAIGKSLKRKQTIKPIKYNNDDNITNNNNQNINNINNNNNNNINNNKSNDGEVKNGIITIVDINRIINPSNTKESNETAKNSNIKQTNKKQTQGTRIKRKYLCHICDKQFLGGNDLRKHIRIHTDERPFECTSCGQRFRQGGCLKNHIASQHGTTQTFTCYYCNKSFPIKERLRLHMRLHSGEKPYECKICHKQFARGGQLTQHLATHNGIKKYHCNQCAASFSCLMNLKLHLKGHANERDYTCHMCGKSFIRPDALKNHLACFHENVKAFYCHLCSRTFKGHLPQHMRTHQNVKSHGCADCGATFSQKSQLIVHQRIHSGERPYRCQVCWQAFAHSSVLKLHIRKHTGEKPFKCMVCKDIGTAFSQLPHLKTHMRAIHGMDKSYNCEFCSEFFKTKHELQEHKIKCSKAQKNNGNGVSFITQTTEHTSYGNETAMSLSKMRLLVAVLIKKISTQDRLKQLGFDKRLIDNVLIAALRVAGQPICDDIKLTEAERLRTNVNQFLEWTVPETYMKKFKREQRSPEELLENLTSSFKRDNSNESAEQVLSTTK